MIYIEAPKEYTVRNSEPTLFLAGGITNCGNWQMDVVNGLKGIPITIYNPRREKWDISDPTVNREQISWEFRYLNSVGAILFWFAPETLCPITLFEYGKYITQQNKRLFVGCHKDYCRTEDILIQTGLARPKQLIHRNLDSLIGGVKEWANEHTII